MARINTKNADTQNASENETNAEPNVDQVPAETNITPKKKEGEPLFDATGAQANTGSSDNPGAKTALELKQSGKSARPKDQVLEEVDSEDDATYKIVPSQKESSFSVLKKIDGSWEEIGGTFVNAREAEQFVKRVDRHEETAESKYFGFKSPEQKAEEDAPQADARMIPSDGVIKGPLNLIEEPATK